MEVIRETLWKRCLSTPTKPPAKNSNICLSETAYQHKGTRKKCKKTNQADIIQWQRQYWTNHIASHYRSWKQATFLKQSPSPLHHTFLLGRARFTAQFLSALFLSYGAPLARTRVWSSARKPLLITWSWKIKLWNQLRQYTRYNSQI